MQNKIQILSTKKISGSLSQFGSENNICIDQVDFIEAKDIVSREMKKRIIELSADKINAIFTSSNAVSIVGKIVSPETKWKIFCIEPATKKVVAHVFANSSIAGTGKDALELSEKVTNDKSVKEVVFFCGNQRRDLLPAHLENNGIAVEELVVYETIENAKTVSKTYDAILFFSPSAVRSFFLKNNLQEEVTIFAIGETTAEEVRVFSKNKTVVSKTPDTQKLIEQVIEYFGVPKTV